ncbi:MAG: DNA-binding protein WhiA [Clostridia bacterium]|nr:DNA-binding protein WhiA [Clostridia bacterium]
MQNESFTSLIKSELALARIKRRTDALALVSAFTLGIGSLKYVPDAGCWGVHCVIKSRPALEHIAKLVSQHYDLTCRLSEVYHERLNTSYCELLIFGPDIDAFMLDTGIVSRDSEGEKQFVPAVNEAALKTETQKKLFVRGLFLACGMVSEPKKAYHAEFVSSNESVLRAAGRILSYQGIEPKLSKRKNSKVLYIKDGEKLEDLLAFIGASSAMMQVSNERIVKQAKNEANRGVNCINANLERATKAAQKQAEDIRLVLDTVGVDNLPESLRIVAEERMNNFELSLSELADELSLGKSAVNYRLKKLQEMAEDIRNGFGPDVKH